MCAILVSTVCFCTGLAGACMQSISLGSQFHTSFPYCCYSNLLHPPLLSACKCQLFCPLRLIFTLIMRAERSQGKTENVVKFQRWSATAWWVLPPNPVCVCCCICRYRFTTGRGGGCVLGCHAAHSMQPLVSMAASLHNCEWKTECCPNKASVFSVTQSVSVCVAPSNIHTQTHTPTQMCQGKKRGFFVFLGGINALQWYIFHGTLESAENTHAAIFMPPPFRHWMLESFPVFFLPGQLPIDCKAT